MSCILPVFHLNSRNNLLATNYLVLVWLQNYSILLLVHLIYPNPDSTDISPSKLNKTFNFELSKAFCLLFQKLKISHVKFQKLIIRRWFCLFLQFPGLDWHQNTYIKTTEWDSRVLNGSEWQSSFWALTYWNLFSFYHDNRQYIKQSVGLHTLHWKNTCSFLLLNNVSKDSWFFSKVVLKIFSKKNLKKIFTVLLKETCRSLFQFLRL